MSEVHDNPLKAEKRKKLHALKEKGINPYPYTFEKTANTTQLRDQFEAQMQAGDKKPETIYALAGRVMTVRAMGKAVFFNLRDMQGSLQVYLKTEELSPEAKVAFEHLDLGDIVGVQYLELHAWADGYIGAVALGGLMFGCGLPGWALVRAIFTAIERRRSSDIVDLAAEARRRWKGKR
jgi:ERCC4-type nuclease